MRQRILRTAFIVLLGLAGLFVAPQFTGRATAANPITINFQGKVVNNTTGNVGTNVTDGTYTFVFKLYIVASGGSAIWTETDSLSVTSGVFQVALGNSCPFFTANACNGSTPIDFNTDPNLYLGITFNSDPAGEMTPRIQLQSVPYAYNSDKLGGIAATGFVQLGATQSGNINIGTGTISSGAINGQTISSTAVFSGTVQVQGASSLTLGTTSNVGSLALYNGTNTVSIQGAASTSGYSIILPASSSSAANLCLANTTASTGTLQWIHCGGSATTSSAVLSPEFPGAVLTPPASANTHVGTMTSDFCSNTVGSIPNINNTICQSGQSHNYYAWTDSSAATNDYDVWAKWIVPGDFASFSAASFYGWKTSTTDAVTVTLYNAAGTSCGSASLGGTNAQWNSTSITTSCTPSPGEVMTVDVDLKVATNGDFARIGEITLSYNRL